MGPAGRQIIIEKLPELKKKDKIDFTNFSQLAMNKTHKRCKK